MGDQERHHSAMAMALINDPKHWRERAEAARRVAADMADPEAKRMMLNIADGYDVSHNTPKRDYSPEKPERSTRSKKSNERPGINDGGHCGQTRQDAWDWRPDQECRNQ